MTSKICFYICPSTMQKSWTCQKSNLERVCLYLFPMQLFTLKNRQNATGDGVRALGQNMIL